MNNIIFLDLDGVLINTFPVWKKDELDEDGYSKFNEKLVANLNSVLNYNPKIKIVVSSSRRVGKDMDRLEEIFSFRGIKGKLIDKVPEPEGIYTSREKEISKYIEDNKVKDFLIIDDDKSLLDLSDRYINGLILTEYREGFNEECLEKAMSIVETWSFEG